MSRAKPAGDFPLPAPLLPTHAHDRDLDAEVAGDGEQLIDVFAEPGPNLPLELRVMANQLVPIKLDRRARHELQVCIYPLPDGTSTYAWLYIVPQVDGTVILSVA
jgi:hypothetical protein